MQILNERIAHMHGVAEWMYEHAEEHGLTPQEYIDCNGCFNSDIPSEEGL